MRCWSLLFESFHWIFEVPSQKDVSSNIAVLLPVHILFEKILLFFLSSYLLSSLSFRSFLVQSRYGELTQTFRFFPFFSFLYIFRILSLMECCLSSACLIERPGLLLTRFIAAIWQNDETAPRDAIPTIRNVSHTEPFYLLVDIYKAQTAK